MDGVGDHQALLTHATGSLLVEQNGEWLVGRRYLSAESIGLVLEDEADRKEEANRYEWPCPSQVALRGVHESRAAASVDHDGGGTTPEPSARRADAAHAKRAFSARGLPRA